MSETIFTTLFVSFMLWTFSPFVMARKRFYTAVIWSRLLMVLVGECVPLLCPWASTARLQRLQQPAASGLGLDNELSIQDDVLSAVHANGQSLLLQCARACASRRSP